MSTTTQTLSETFEVDLLTVKEVARQLRVDDTTVRRWIKGGALEAVTLPHRGKRQIYRVHHAIVQTLLSTAQHYEG